MRVVIAEDQALLREGIGRLFQDAGHEVADLLPDAERLALSVEIHRPDLVVLDVRMPPTFTDEGIKAAHQLRHGHPAVAVLLLSQHVVVTHAAELVELGAFGYLLKDRVFDVQEFVAAAERVAGGGSALDPKVVERLLAAGSATGPLDGLSVRERELLALMAEGLTNAGIADRLVLSERTVESHIRSLLLKLDLPKDAGAHRRVLAVLAYLRSEAQPVSDAP
jgi:DNA-binding NarL/FixJ family response regulator